ncbi:MAG: hypothetical protein JW841_08515 [Deltaproteobacteria bacterium]|nr:hypothetical protein [Deltaproteobacteria bacterium]
MQLGQMTLAGHIAEVWNSTVIQKKMQQMRAGVESQLAQKLNRALANKHHNGSGETEISDSDRQELETLLRKSQ